MLCIERWVHRTQTFQFIYQQAVTNQQIHKFQKNVQLHSTSLFVFLENPHPEYNENSIQLIRMLPKVKKCKNIYSMTIKCFKAKLEQEIIWFMGFTEFPKLKYLLLADCNIHSIQGLNLINCRLLKTLDLSNNKITSIKPLRRTHFPKLKQLFIQNNEIHQLQRLSQANFKQIQTISIHIQSSQIFVNFMRQLPKLEIVNEQIYPELSEIDNQFVTPELRNTLLERFCGNVWDLFSYY